jgi:hypothetical protein
VRRAAEERARREREEQERLEREKEEQRRKEERERVEREKTERAIRGGVRGVRGTRASTRGRGAVSSRGGMFSLNTSLPVLCILLMSVCCICSHDDHRNISRRHYKTSAIVIVRCWWFWNSSSILSAELIKRLTTCRSVVWLKSGDIIHFTTLVCVHRLLRLACISILGCFYKGQQTRPVWWCLLCYTGTGYSNDAQHGLLALLSTVQFAVIFEAISRMPSKYQDSCRMICLHPVTSHFMT